MINSTKEHIVNNMSVSAEENGKLCKETYRKKVSELNDQLRRFGQGGMVVMTDGVALLDRSTVTAVFQAVTAFDSFTEANDPWGERDFAALTVQGIRVMFKIDYFDKTRTYHSSNPADPKVTTRIMTVMLADEY